MTSMKETVLKLYEYEPRDIAYEELPLPIAKLLKQKYPNIVSVEAKETFTPGSDWRLNSQGWIGFIPLTPEFGIRLLPRRGITITNLFDMLEYAYDLKSFHPLKGLTNFSSSEEDLYDRFMIMLARYVLNRARKGFYYSYRSRSDQLPYVRGRIDLSRKCFKPWEIKPECYFEEHTSDIDDNGILLWTLKQILRSGLCTEKSLPIVHQAYLKLAGFTELKPYTSIDCIGRKYNRLNQDYEPMHALCRFFLENLAPGHEVGDRKMIPFLVDMDRLYELFVARWLKSNALQGYRIESQEKVPIDRQQNTKFVIDLVVYSKTSNQTVCVLDTKYKIDPPSTSDIEQVVAYAVSKGCREAILIYPVDFRPPRLFTVKEIHVRSATFSLEGNLRENGLNFIREVFGPGALDNNKKISVCSG